MRSGMNHAYRKDILEKSPFRKRSEMTQKRYRKRTPQGSHRISSMQSPIQLPSVGNSCWIESRSTSPPNLATLCRCEWYCIYYKYRYGEKLALCPSLRLTERFKMHQDIRSPPIYRYISRKKKTMWTIHCKNPMIVNPTNLRGTTSSDTWSAHLVPSICVGRYGYDFSDLCYKV